MSHTHYIKTFLEEKVIPFQIFEIQDKNGLTHFVDTEVIKESILACGLSEKIAIANAFKKIDYANSSIISYFHFLAKILIK
jgi:hypothetical protein